MLCSISGEHAREPVVSPKSGNIFEKSLLLSYIEQNGTDPINGQELSSEEVIEIKSSDSQAVRPKPPVYTSIPSLLSSLQNEWDAMTLETFSLKQQLLKTRQELSSALYHHDAAVRVVARLTKERDEARDALNKLSTSLGAATTATTTTADATTTNGQEQAMDVDEQGVAIPQEIQTKISQTQEQLFANRKGRKVPESWPTKDTIAAMSETNKTKQLFTSVSSLAASPSGKNVVSGGGKSAVGIYSLEEQKLVCTGQASGIVTAGVWLDDDRIAIGTKNGAIDVFTASSLEKTGSLMAHSGAVCNLSVLPITNASLVISVGKDNKWGLHDLEALTTIVDSPVDGHVNCSAIHPDGQFFAIGCGDGRIIILDLIKGQPIETLVHNEEIGSINSLAFSEDGRSLASANNSNTVHIWNLAKPKDLPKMLQFNKLKDSPLSHVAFDYSGKFLVGCGTSGLEVGWYDKRAKSWESNVFHATVSSVSVEWGSEARTLVSISSKGSVHVFQC